ncbi:transposase [Endozoicomonas sp.]|uniref:transposase n=1 Tax=Endozoicomonas sp. TaxID=1892382 RepID=UPI00383A22E8
MAYWARKPGKGLLHHSDQESQYASHDYQAELKKYHMPVSMSLKGNCRDNAIMERFFGSLKRECTDHSFYDSRREAERDVVDYILFYNNNRRHSDLDYCSPTAFEEKRLEKAA